MSPNAENDAPGITYIDAPLPATVLNLAYRMHADWGMDPSGTCFCDDCNAPEDTRGDSDGDS